MFHGSTYPNLNQASRVRLPAGFFSKHALNSNKLFLLKRKMVINDMLTVGELISFLNLFKRKMSCEKMAVRNAGFRLLKSVVQNHMSYNNVINSHKRGVFMLVDCAAVPRMSNLCDCSWSLNITR